MKKYLYILFVLIFLFIPIFAQQFIDIKNFSGVVTNYDFEDLPQENFVELKNLRSINGKLVKTFEFGKNDYPVKPTTFSTLYNLVMYINPYLVNPTGYDPLLYAVTTTDTVYVAYWNSLSGAWVYFNFSETFVHSQSTNPVVQADGVIRFLPGAVGSIGGRQAKGMWIGYIDSVWVFDHKYRISNGFYSYSIPLIAPNIITTVTLLDSGTIDEDKYYKYSYLYDGIQETLLSKIGYNIDYYNNTYGLLKFVFDTLSLNRRITGMNVYRSDDLDGIYNKIHSIDFTRLSEDTTRGSFTNNAINGAWYVYVPHTTMKNYSFNPAGTYGIKFDATLVRISSSGLGGTGSEIFTISSLDNPINIDKWNSFWQLQEDSGSGYVNVTGVYGVDSGFASSKMIITNMELGRTSYPDGYIYLEQTQGFTSSREIRQIDKIHAKAVHFTGSNIVTSDSTLYKPWHLFRVSNGNYYTRKDKDSIFVYFLDSHLTIGAEHPLAGEVSININGQYAKIIGNRLWQGNIVLDPGGKNEVHTDWISYSEIGQYDVNPVSNIISFANQGLGEITGINELFGYPVIIKKNNVSLINIKDYPVEPAKWNIIESVHNIGNISTNGIITVLGHIYLPYYDGIYEFAPSEIAPSSTTPSRIFKITEPIDDKYMALTLTQKDSIISEYNQKYNEIIFKLGTELWAYSLLYKSWRELDITSFTPTFFCLDQNANILAYNSTDTSFYNSDSTGNTRAYLKSKTFSIADDIAKPIKFLWLTHKGHASADLQFKLYLENSSVPYLTQNISTVDSIKTEKFGMMVRGKKFFFELLNPQYSTYETEIYRIKLEYEGEK